jgi:hypothetical protein
MFQFSWCPLAFGESLGFTQAGCPIRVSPARFARQLTEAYRSLATPVFGC